MESKPCPRWGRVFLGGNKMFFVIYGDKHGDWESTLARGVEAFTTLESATSFAVIYRNKGYACTIYQGTQL